MLTNFETILSEIKKPRENIFIFNFKLTDPQTIDFLPGQYIILKVPKGNAYAPRLYSIFSSNKIKDQFQLLVEIIPGGLASTYFLNLKVSDKVEFQGPLGQFVLRQNDREKFFLVTGSGIAPVFSILQSFNLPVDRYQIYWGLKSYQSLYLFEELKKYNPKICLSREQNLEIIPEDSRKYFSLGRIDSCFDKFILDTKYEILNTDYYLCGRKDITESLRLFLLAKNIPQEQIFFEKF
ncbi:hypothetical protein HZA76_02080 [Candidatus Roizmanbacteria bacterium]|nr:hypothetical protein [Candidatus Roizmanbacteria bacterium]